MDAVGLARMTLSGGMKRGDQPASQEVWASSDGDAAQASDSSSDACTETHVTSPDASSVPSPSPRSGQQPQQAADFMTQAIKRGQRSPRETPASTKRPRRDEDGTESEEDPEPSQTETARSWVRQPGASSSGVFSPGLHHTARSLRPTAEPAGPAGASVLRTCVHGADLHHTSASPAAEHSTCHVSQHDQDTENVPPCPEDQESAPDDDKASSLHEDPAAFEHHTVIPEASEHEGAVEEEDLDYVEFDPLSFIRSLPPLEAVIPPQRPQLLPCKSRTCTRKTLVLDLDETLVHSCLEPVPNADFTFPVHFNGQEHIIHVRQRPHLHTFMQRVSELFEVVVFTASQKIYAEQLLDIIDPGRQYISHRIFRESCVIVDGNYLKDLTALGRDLRSTLIVDNSPQAFGFQVDNGVPIESWYENMADTELLKLLPFLEGLVGQEDVRPAIKDRYKMRELINRAGQAGVC